MDGGLLWLVLAVAVATFVEAFVDCWRVHRAMLRRDRRDQVRA